MDKAAPVYFVSCGPGDPALVTRAGIDAIARSPSVLAPAAYAESFAELLAGKDVQSPFVLDHDAVLAWVRERLTRGPVAILVPGDFTFFCPFQSFVAPFRDRARVIPGVSAHAAAAALLGKTFDMPGVAFATVITSPKAYTRDGGRADFSSVAGEGRTLVLYMNHLPAEELAEQLKSAYPGDTPVAVLERIATPDQHITRATLDTLARALAGRDPYGVGSDSPEPTLALTVVGRVIAEDEPPRWWNHRHATIWKPRGMR